MEMINIDPADLAAARQLDQAALATVPPPQSPDRHAGRP
jgi:hypothetical protein